MLERRAHGTVDDGDALNRYEGKLRLMKATGSYTNFDVQDYTDYLREQVVPRSYGKIPFAHSWNKGFALDLDAPRGIYRANCLARINMADRMTTPHAQAELEEFRSPGPSAVRLPRVKPPCSHNRDHPFKTF